MKRLLLFVVIALSCVVATAQIEFDAATSLYQQNEFDKARKAFESLALYGHRPSLFNIGVMHYRGQGYSQNVSRGVAFMKLANEDHNDVGFSKVISSITASMSPAQLKKVHEALQALRNEFDIDQIIADIQPVAVTDESFDELHKSEDMALPIHPYVETQRGRNGIVMIYATLSPEGYARDVVVDMSTSTSFTQAALNALQTYRISSDNKTVQPLERAFIFVFELPELTGFATVRSKNARKENEKLKAAAESGVARYQYLYGKRLLAIRHFKERKESRKVQYQTANEWFFRAAQQGFSAAQFEIGLSFIYGRGCEKNGTAGFKWLEAAAQTGFAPAQRLLGQLLVNRQQQGEAGLSWLQMAMTQGDAPAQILLAWERLASQHVSTDDADRVLSFLTDDVDAFHDDVRIFETYALAYAVKGQYKKAVKYQKKARRMAKRYGWSIPLLEERLTLYENKAPYVGSYH